MNHNLFRENPLYKIIVSLAKIEYYLIMICIIPISVYFSLGSFSENYYKKIMSRTAHNYNVVEWIYKNVPKDAIVVSDVVRSHALYKNRFISREEFFRKDFFKMNKIYSPTHLVLEQPLTKKMYEIKDKCLVEIDTSEKFTNEVRNLFSLNKGEYIVKLYKNKC